MHDVCVSQGILVLDAWLGCDISPGVLTQGFSLPDALLLAKSQHSFIHSFIPSVAVASLVCQTCHFSLWQVCLIVRYPWDAESPFYFSFSQASKTKQILSHVSSP